MIGILSEQVTTIFLEKLGMEYMYLEDNDQDISGLFIDWVPKLPESEGAWIKQASLLHHYIKKNIPIIIFDRYFFLNEKEANWVKKFGVVLFEPALYSGRYGFEYLPEWIDSFDIDENEDREFDLIYPGIEYNISGFEKWIAEYASLFSKKVAYSANNSLSDFKREEYKKKNLVEISGNYERGNITLAIDGEKSYKCGYFCNRYFKAMNKGCLPLLPIQHKYFHGLFNGLIIEDIKKLNLHISMFAKFKNVLIEEIFERVKTNWSEFTVDHATDIIRNCLVS